MPCAFGGHLKRTRRTHNVGAVAKFTKYPPPAPPPLPRAAQEGWAVHADIQMRSNSAARNWTYRSFRSNSASQQAVQYQGYLQQKENQRGSGVRKKKDRREEGFVVIRKA